MYDLPGSEVIFKVMRLKIQIFQFELWRVSFNLIVHIDFKYIWYKVMQGHLQGHRVKNSIFSDWTVQGIIQLDFSCRFQICMHGWLKVSHLGGSMSHLFSIFVMVAHFWATLEFLNLILGTLDIFWTGFEWIRTDSYGISRICTDSQGFTGICTDSHRFARIRTDSHGFKRIQTDSNGFARIRTDSNEFEPSRDYYYRI